MVKHDSIFDLRGTREVNRTIGRIPLRMAAINRQRVRIATLVYINHCIGRSVVRSEDVAILFIPVS